MVNFGQILSALVSTYGFGFTASEPLIDHFHFDSKTTLQATGKFTRSVAEITFTVKGMAPGSGGSGTAPKYG